MRLVPLTTVKLPNTFSYNDENSKAPPLATLRSKKLLHDAVQPDAP
jgi:hypothetical protein